MIQVPHVSNEVVERGGRADGARQTHVHSRQGAVVGTIIGAEDEVAMGGVAHGD